MLPLLVKANCFEADKLNPLKFANYLLQSETCVRGNFDEQLLQMGFFKTN